MSVGRMLMTLAAGASLGLAACQTTPGAPRMATLERMTPEAMETLTKVLGEATKQGRVVLGPGDLTQDSTISVLPPPPGPLEGRSMAMPALFDLMTDGKDCFVRDRKSGGMHALPGVSCRPMAG